jgi:hypothetical protein
MATIAQAIPRGKRHRDHGRSCRLSPALNTVRQAVAQTHLAALVPIDHDEKFIS